MNRTPAAQTPPIPARVDEGLDEPNGPSSGPYQQPSQDHRPEAQERIDAATADREAGSVLVGGGIAAGAAAGAAIGTAVAGPVGTLVGGTVGAVAGAVGGLAAGPVSDEVARGDSYEER